jgi:hypothetical protein
LLRTTPSSKGDGVKSDIKPALLVVDPDRVYRSGEKFFRTLAFSAGDLRGNENLKT